MTRAKRKGKPSAPGRSPTKYYEWTTYRHAKRPAGSGASRRAARLANRLGIEIRRPPRDHGYALRVKG